MSARYQYIADVVGALAHEARVEIVELLATRGMPVKEIMVKMNLAASTTSRHLSIMKRAGIVTCCRDKQRVIYSVALPCVLTLIAGVRERLEHLCGGLNSAAK